MTLAVALKLLALMLVVAAGWVAGRTGWLGGAEVPEALWQLVKGLCEPTCPR